MKIKDIKRGTIEPITYWEANLSNGETARQSGSDPGSWKRLVKYTKDNDLDIYGIRIVVRSRFYHLPTLSENYRFRSKIPQDLTYIDKPKFLGIKAKYPKFDLIVWVNKAKGHSWVQVK